VELPVVGECGQAQEEGLQLLRRRRRGRPRWWHWAGLDRMGVDGGGGFLSYDFAYGPKIGPRNPRRSPSTLKPSPTALAGHPPPAHHRITAMPGSAAGQELQPPATNAVRHAAASDTIARCNCKSAAVVRYQRPNYEDPIQHDEFFQLAGKRAERACGPDAVPVRGRPRRTAEGWKRKTRRASHQTQPRLGRTVGGAAGTGTRRRVASCPPPNPTSRWLGAPLHGA
jgi:hypothetical protein